MIRKKWGGPMDFQGGWIIYKAREYHSQLERECSETDQCFPRGKALRETLMWSQDTPSLLRNELPWSHE